MLALVLWQRSVKRRRVQQKQAAFVAAIVAKFLLIAACGPEPCMAPDTDCDGQCVDLNTDPSNCGECGRTCPIGSDEKAWCANATCYRAAVLATNQGEPRGIALSASHVYWANRREGAVVRVPKVGGEATPVATDQAGAFTVLVDDTHAYWSVDCPGTFDYCPGEDSFALRKAPLGGGAPTELVANVRAVSMALDERQVYYCVGWVMQVPKTGLDAPLSIGESCLGSIAVDRLNLYVANGLSLVQVGLADQSRVRLATAQADIQSLALSDSHVYWIEATQGVANGRLRRVPIDGVDPELLTTFDGLYYPSIGCDTLAVDEQHAYWVASSPIGEPHTGKILRVSIEGGEVTPVVEGILRPTCLTVDATHVYWTDRVGDVVLRVVK